MIEVVSATAGAMKLKYGCSHATSCDTQKMPNLPVGNVVSTNVVGAEFWRRLRDSVTFKSNFAPNQLDMGWHCREANFAVPHQPLARGSLPSKNVEK